MPALPVAIALFAALFAATLPSLASPPPNVSSGARGLTIALYNLRPTLTTPVADTPAYRDIWDECHAIFTLQGIVNRDAPRLFVDYIIAQGAGQKIDVDRHWLDKFRREGQWLDSRATSLKTCASLEELVAAFSPNGIVAQSPSLPAAFLRGDMPVMRSGLTLNKEKDPATVAKTLVATVARQRAIPFHWFRTILRSPAWHVELMNEVKRLDPNVELLDAPTFFELYRMWLKEIPNPEIPNPKKIPNPK